MCSSFLHKNVFFQNCPNSFDFSGYKPFALCKNNSCQRKSFLLKTGFIQICLQCLLLTVLKKRKENWVKPKVQWKTNIPKQKISSWAAPSSAMEKHGFIWVPFYLLWPIITDAKSYHTQIILTYHTTVQNFSVQCDLYFLKKSIHLFSKGTLHWSKETFKTMLK